MQDYEKMNDEALLNLLFTEGDRLPRAAVDEFIQRGERMVEPLSEIMTNKYKWTKGGPEWWVVVHAVFILGAIGGSGAVLPLLQAARWAVAFDCDWITEDLPSIFGRIGVAAIDYLKKIAEDKTTDWYTRAIAMDGLAATTLDNPKTEKEIFEFIYSVMVDEENDRDVRQTAAHILLDFLRSEYRDDLLAFGREERMLKDEDKMYPAAFYEDEVDEEFSKAKKELWMYTRDWLSFYNEDEIRERQERWKRERKTKDEDEDLKWEEEE